MQMTLASGTEQEQVCCPILNITLRELSIHQHDHRSPALKIFGNNQISNQSPCHYTGLSTIKIIKIVPRPELGNGKIIEINVSRIDHSVNTAQNWIPRKCRSPQRQH